VPGLFTLRLAALKALASEAHGRLTTRSLHSQLLFNLSPTNHVRASLLRSCSPPAEHVS
jgi:hypothetical protein